MKCSEVGCDAPADVVVAGYTLCDEHNRKSLDADNGPSDNGPSSWLIVGAAVLLLTMIATSLWSEIKHFF